MAKNSVRKSNVDVLVHESSREEREDETDIRAREIKGIQLIV